MADYHILAGDRYANAFTVIFHIPVPDQTNEAAVNYRVAVVEWQGGAANIISQVPGIGSELTQLQAGELYEVSERFNSNPNETPAQKQARLDVRWAEIRTEEATRLEKVLSYWGFDRVIP